MSERAEGSEPVSTGWQDDGSYVPCPDCGWKPAPHKGPGIPVRQAGTTHNGDCPQFAWIAESERELAPVLEAMARARRRAAAEAANYVIG